MNADDALRGLPKKEQSQLATQLRSKDFRGQFTDLSHPASERASARLALAASFAIAPISGFQVGAIAVGSSGAVYLGANLEFTNAPLSTTLHAEQSAILNARSHGETAIVSLFVSEAPCGHCRQFLNELQHAADMLIHFRGHTVKLKDLLTLPFSASRTSDDHLLACAPQPIKVIEPIHTAREQHAFDAARHSYTPYTNSPEGCSLESEDGQHFTGSTAESCAFNPTVTPIMSALNQHNLSHSRNQAITACTHTQHQGARHSNIQVTQMLLKSLGVSDFTVLATEDT